MLDVVWWPNFADWRIYSCTLVSLPSKELMAEFYLRAARFGSIEGRISCSSTYEEEGRFGIWREVLLELDAFFDF